MKFEFWYTETDTFKAFFEADNLEEAKRLLNEAIKLGNVSDLPEFDSYGKDYEATYSPETLKESLA